MQKTCHLCSSQFEVTDEDLKFYDLVSPVFCGKKYSLPTPTLCPLCRRQRRMTWRNERSLYQGKCDMTGNQIISVYSPDKPFKTYNHKEWRSDNWSPIDYGRNFDFNRPFFEQFRELLEAVPKNALHINDSMVNSEYCNYGAQSKDCYLCTVPVSAEKCFYSRGSYGSFMEFDSYANVQMQFSLECISLWNSYECFFCRYSYGCQTSSFLIDCISCKNCFGCVGLRHKEHMFLNKKMESAAYEKLVGEILSSYKKLQEFSEYFEKWRMQFPYKFARNRQYEDCTGDLIFNCKGCHYCYDIINQQDSKFCELGGEKTHHIYDATVIGLAAVNCYEHIGSMSCNNSLFGVYVTSNIDCHYCVSCRNCENCFGCDGLTRKEYCIFNKQYSKEEYEKVVSKIIEHMQSTQEWGEFFPAKLSPFAYNESVAQDYFSLNKEQVLANGWQWHDPENKIISEAEAYELPDNIADSTEEIIDKPLRCEVTGIPYKIIKQEFEFYKKYGITLPRRSPNQRYIDRLAKQNPYNLWQRNCDKCKLEIMSVYSPQKPETIYCDDCYEKYYN